MSDVLARAETSFIDNLRRVVVMSRLDESCHAPTLRPGVDNLLRWIGEYHEAFVQANQRRYGGRLHSFHHRQLTVAGCGLLAAPGDILRLGRPLLEIGLSLAISVPAEDMARYPLALPTLRSELPGLYVQIECHSRQVDPAAGEADAGDGLSPETRRALTSHVDSGGGLNLVSSIAELRHAGLSEHEGFNRVGFSVSRPSVQGTRPMYRLHRVAPCSDYMGWHIDAAGDVFPCVGMIGHAPARLGNISAPFMEVLQALASTPDAMAGHAERGPTGLEPPASGRFDLCSLHREAVTQLAAI
jgi:hypothetical protein